MRGELAAAVARADAELQLRVGSGCEALSVADGCCRALDCATALVSHLRGRHTLHRGQARVARIGTRLHGMAHRLTHAHQPTTDAHGQARLLCLLTEVLVV